MGCIVYGVAESMGTRLSDFHFSLAEAIRLREYRHRLQKKKKKKTIGSLIPGFLGPQNDVP